METAALHLKILACFGSLLALFLGIGSLCRDGFGLHQESTDDLFLDFWTGWALSLGFLLVWHLVLPVNGWAMAALALLSGVGLWRTRGHLMMAARRARGGAGALLLCGVSIALWIGFFTPGTPGIPDTGYYHLQAIRWAREAPAVPGLVNLKPQLGFSSSHFLYSALLTSGVLPGATFHLANGLLLLVTILHFGGHLLGLVLEPRTGTLQGWFTSLLLLWTTHSLSWSRLSSPTPDTAVDLLGAVLYLRLLEWLQGHGVPVAERRYHLFQLALLAVVGVTIKLSFGVLATCVLALAWARGGREGESSPGARSLAALPWAAWAVLAATAVAWLGHQVIQSGYPLYPVSWFGLPLDWRPPAEEARAIVRAIRLWARLGPAAAGAGGGEPWIGIWWAWNHAELRAPLLYPLALGAGGLLALAGAATAGRASEIRSAPWIFLGAPLVSLAFWFATAPDPRFLGASGWALGSALLLFSLCSIPPARAGVLSGRGGRVLAVLVVLFLSRRFYKRTAEIPDEVWGAREFSLPTVPLRQVPNRQGVIFHLPIEGKFLWDAPLPSRSTPPADLWLRDPARLNAGFRRGGTLEAAQEQGVSDPEP